MNSIRPNRVIFFEHSRMCGATVSLSLSLSLKVCSVVSGRKHNVYYALCTQRANEKASPCNLTPTTRPLSPRSPTMSLGIGRHTKRNGTVTPWRWRRSTGIGPGTTRAHGPADVTHAFYLPPWTTLWDLGSPTTETFNHHHRLHHHHHHHRPPPPPPPLHVEYRVRIIPSEIG